MPRHNPDFIDDARAIDDTVAHVKQQNPQLSKQDARAEATRRLGGPNNFDEKALMAAIDDAYPSSPEPA